MNTPEPQGQKPLPMKLIGMVAAGLFVLLTAAFLIVPAFLDRSPFGKMFEQGPAPWAIPDNEQVKFQFTESQLKGRYHFQQYCAACHGPEGRGNGPMSNNLTKRPPNFIASNVTYTNGLTAEGLQKTLLEGVPGTQMPAFAKLPPEVRQQLSDYVVYLNAHPALF